MIIFLLIGFPYISEGSRAVWIRRWGRSFFASHYSLPSPVSLSETHPLSALWSSSTVVTLLFWNVAQGCHVKLRWLRTATPGGAVYFCSYNQIVFSGRGQWRAWRNRWLFLLHTNAPFELWGLMATLVCLHSLREGPGRSHVAILLHIQLSFAVTWMAHSPCPSRKTQPDEHRWQVYITVFR